MRLTTWTSTILLFIALYSSGTAIGQTTDVDVQVNNVLQSYGPVPVTRIVQTPRTEERCTPGKMGEPNCVNVTVYDSTPQTTNQILAASNIHTVKVSDISWGQMTETQLPNQMIVADVLYQNCNTTTSLTANISISKAFQRSSSLTVTHQVTHTQGTQMGGSYTIRGVFAVSAQITDQNSEMNGTAAVKGDQETTTISVSGTQQVGPTSSMVAEEQFWPVRYEVAFTATVTVDADLSENDRGFTHLSDIVSEAGRTFTVSGVLDAYDASQAALRTFAYAYDASTCTTAKGLTIVQSFIPAPNVRLWDTSTLPNASPKTN